LDGDQRVAEHFLGVLGGFVGRPNQHDAGLILIFFESAFSTSTGMDLGFENCQIATNVL